LGCTGEPVHHHCPVLVREFEDIAASIDDEHFNYIYSWSKVWSRTKSEACKMQLEVVISTWKQSNWSQYM
jgi:hypothetical protein